MKKNKLKEKMQDKFNLQLVQYALTALDKNEKKLKKKYKKVKKEKKELKKEYKKVKKEVAKKWE